MRSGFIQETYSLCRTIDEASEDIWFMSTPLGEGGQPSEDQRRFIDEFFQEEFADPSDLLSPAKRDRVPRKKIRAALTRIPGAESKNPSHELAVVRTLDQTFSGSGPLGLRRSRRSRPCGEHASENNWLKSARVTRRIQSVQSATGSIRGKFV
jgi:hypothetical protein